METDVDRLMNLGPIKRFIVITIKTISLFFVVGAVLFCYINHIPILGIFRFLELIVLLILVILFSASCFIGVYAGYCLITNMIMMQSQLKHGIPLRDLMFRRNPFNIFMREEYLSRKGIEYRNSARMYLLIFFLCALTGMTIGYVFNHAV